MSTANATEPTDADETSGAYRSRIDQIMDLSTDAILTVIDDPDDPKATGASLELYVKELPRGEHYVCDFVYSDHPLESLAKWDEENWHAVDAARRGWSGRGGLDA